MLLLLFCQKTQLWGVQLLQSTTVFCPMREELIIRQQEYSLRRTREFTVFPVISRAMQAIMFIYRLQKMMQNVHPTFIKKHFSSRRTDASVIAK